MLGREPAIRALRGVRALTAEVERALREFNDIAEHDRDDLETYQVRNRQVESWLSKALGRDDWNETLVEKVREFLSDEFEKQKLITRKMVILRDAGHLPNLWEELQRQILANLTETREVIFLWTDLHAYDGLGADAHATYRMMIEPVTINPGKITIILEEADNIAALTEPQHIDGAIAFATNLRTRVREYSHANSLPDNVGIGIGIACGGCKFNLLTGKPLPDESRSLASAWYEAGKLMYQAERLCKHLKNTGGVIVVSDGLASMLPGRFTRVNQQNIHQELQPIEINILSD